MSLRAKRSNLARKILNSLRLLRRLTPPAERNAGFPAERRIELRVGVHLGDVIEVSDGDLMGDGVNIAARLEGVAKPGAVCLSEDAYRQVRSRLNLQASDLESGKARPPRLSIVVLPFAGGCQRGRVAGRSYAVEGVGS